VKLGRRKQVFRKLIQPPTSGKGRRSILHNHSHENPNYHSLCCKTNDNPSKCSTREGAFDISLTSEQTQDQTKTQAYRLSSITLCNNPSSFLKHSLRTIPGRRGANKKGSCMDQTSRFRRLSILCCSISSAYEQKVKLRTRSVERHLFFTPARRTVRIVSC
jgi:hypothetical protein